MELTLEREHEDCQRLINYLVYMEGLAALIKRNVMHLGVIDDLFAYRLFISVNSPVVQKFELLPYANYYQGCFELSEMWTKEWNRRGRTIPLDHYSLCKCDKAVQNGPAENRSKTMLNVLVRRAKKTDDVFKIASCIYLTDPFIYPAAFGTDIEKAVCAISQLMSIEGCFFHPDNIALALRDEEVCGILLYNKGGLGWERSKSTELVRGIVPSVEYFSYVSDVYYSVEAAPPEEHCIEIVACCVMPEFRGMGIGKQLLNWLITEYSEFTMALDILANNPAAIRLYENCGFEIVGKMKGFSLEEKDRPDCFRMVRCANSR